MPKKKIAVVGSQKYRIQGHAAFLFNQEWDKISIQQIASSIPGLQFKQANNGKLSCKCIFHEDDTESAVILPPGGGPAVYHCSSCGSATLFEVYAYSMHAENGGDATVLACEDFGISKNFAVVGVKNSAVKEKHNLLPSGDDQGNTDLTVDRKLKSGFTDPGLSEERLDELYETLLNDQSALDYIDGEKGISLEIIKKYKIGLFNRGKGDIRYIYPIRNQSGQLINYRQYNPKKQPKYLGIDSVKADGLLPYNIEIIENNPIILVEGESDSLCGRSFGLNTYSTTAGAGTFKDEWVKQFEGKDVGICYDNDQAGITGSILVAEKLQSVAKSVRLMKQLSKKPNGGDLCDFLVAEGGTKQQIIDHYHNTPIFNGDVSLLESFVDVEFDELVNLKPNTRVRTKFKIFTVDSQLGLLSSRIKIDCKRGTKKYCHDCPAENQDEFIIPITPQSIDFMQSHNISIDTTHLRKLLRLNCPDIYGEFDNKYKLYHAGIHHPQSPFSNTKQIDDCIIVSDEHLDMNNPILFESQIEVGQFPKSGGGKGVKTQTWFCFKPTQIQSEVESFSVDNEFEYLTLFKSKPGFSEVKKKLDEIYDDLESKIAIIGRRDMIIAADLCFLSAKEIEIQSGIFKDKFKGTMECAFFGATRTGKTAAIERLSKLYKSGKLYDCANLSHAALIGMAHGSNNSGAKFTPGILPKADGDLVIFDEADKYEGEGKFNKLTATRSSGIARYNKRDQSFSLPARVRILWIANPPGGRVMGDYTFPFEVFLGVMKQQAAVSRFDLAISIISKDFKKQVINDLNKFQLESYQKLLLFSRSLKPERIEITQSAIDYINESTKDLFDTFGKDKGPVSNDIEEKLMRIATAVAIRVFSYDVFKEKLTVNEDHAQMAVHLMHTLHSSVDVGYDKMHALERDLSTDMRDPAPFYDAIEFIPDNDMRALFCQTVEENIGTAEFDRDELINIFPKKDYINGGHFFEKMVTSGAVYARVSKEDGKITKTRYKFSRDGMLYMSAIRELGLESKRKVEERVKQMKSNEPEQQEMLA